MIEFAALNCFLYANKETLESLSKLNHQSAWLEMRIGVLEGVINNTGFKDTNAEGRVGEWWTVFRDIDRE